MYLNYLFITDLFIEFVVKSEDEKLFKEEIEEHEYEMELGQDRGTNGRKTIFWFIFIYIFTNFYLFFVFLFPIILTINIG